MTPRQMPKTERLAFLDALAQHIGHVERRDAREHTAHKYGYGPVLVWSASSGEGTLLVSPYSSGSGVVRVHMNRYAEASLALGWTAEVTCMPDELLGLVEWIVMFVRKQSMGHEIALHESFDLPGPVILQGLPGYTRRHYIGVWTKRATEHEKVNGRGASLVKENA